MNCSKKLLTAVLTLLLVLCFAGCNGLPANLPTTSAPTTTVPSTTAPTTTPPASIDRLYEEASAAAAALTEAVLEQETSMAVTVGGETFTSSEKSTVTYTGRDQEHMTASVVTDVNYDGEVANITEIFDGARSYVTLSYYLGDFNFQAEITAEDFAVRYLPPVLMDAALYAAVTGGETDGGYTISFSDPTAPEAWLGLPEDAILVSAEGTASLDASGSLTGSSYHITYTIAGAEYVFSAAQSIGAPSSPRAVPQNTDDYLTVGHPDVPKWFVRADGHLLQAQSISSTTSKLTLTAAGGASLVQITEVNTYGSGTDLMAKVEQDINQVDYTSGGQETSLNMVELFRDGKYTSSTDGGAPEKNTAVTADVIETYVGNSLLENIPYVYDLATAELTDLGGSIIIEFTLNEEFEDALCKELNLFLFQDENFLGDLASSYTVETLEGYLAFDKYTGLPTAVGTNYSATHTIYGQPYVLMEQVDQNFDLASLYTYEAITEEGSPDAEPEAAPTPLFYKVTGTNGQTMWLLGTIHVGDNRTGHLPQEIYDAFSAADALAVECDTQSFEEKVDADEALQDLISEAYTYSDGSVTKDHIKDEELYTYALRMLKASGNYNFNGLYFKPSVWSSSLDNFYLKQGYQLLSDKGVDHRLLKMAREQGKTILEVESNEFQIQMLNGWSEELQELLLLESCSVDYPEYCAGTLELYEAWLTGNEAELIEILSDDVDTSEMTEEELAEYEQYKDLLDEYNKTMGPDRNDDMLKVAIEYLESGDTVFYAVGLAHLLAEDGLVNTLRDAGYTVELVSYQ